jgi:hypothetical protein
MKRRYDPKGDFHDINLYASKLFAYLEKNRAARIQILTAEGMVRCRMAFHAKFDKPIHQPAKTYPADLGSLR